MGTAGTFPEDTGSTSDTGGLVGGTVGANFQTDAFVFGVEGDWDYSAINTGTTGAVCSMTGTCQTGNNWLATARARVGYAADRVLFFGTAGGAFANMQTTYSGVQTSTQRPDGQPARASNGPLPITGRPRSSIFTSISARLMGTASTVSLHRTGIGRAGHSVQRQPD